MVEAMSTAPREKAKRAQLSCLKCRARKVKCDRNLPCSSCAQYQTPDGCRYDMSDDKRQPILQADRIKQLERVNGEQAAKMICLERRLAVYESDYQQRLSGTRSQPPPIAVSTRSGSRRSSSQVAKRRYTSRSTHHNRQTFYIPPPHGHNYEQVTSTAVKRGSPLDLFDSSFHTHHRMTGASATISSILAKLETGDKPIEALIDRCVHDLLQLLNDLVPELQPSLPRSESGPAGLHGMVVENLMFSQTVHSHIVMLLARLGTTSIVALSESQCPPILLRDSYRQQIISSSLMIFFSFDYINKQTVDAEPLSRTLQHACMVTQILTRLDPPFEAVLYQSHIQKAVDLLQALYLHGGINLAASIADALMGLLSRSSNQTFLGNSEAGFQLSSRSNLIVLPPSHQIHDWSTIQQCFNNDPMKLLATDNKTSIKNESPVNETAQLAHQTHHQFNQDSHNKQDSISGPWTTDTGFRENQHLSMSRSTSHKPYTSGQTGTDESLVLYGKPSGLDEQLVFHEMSSLQNDHDSTYYNDHNILMTMNDEPIPQAWSCTASAPKKAAPSMMSSPYSPSVYTPDSSIRTPSGSHPVSPMLTQGLANKFDKDSQSFQYIPPLQKHQFCFEQVYWQV